MKLAVAIPLWIFLPELMAVYHFIKFLKRRKHNDAD